MSETAVRDVLQEAMNSHEPPIDPELLDSVVCAARRSRRRRLAAAIGAAAVIVPSLAFGGADPGRCARAGQYRPAHDGASAGRWQP